MAGDPIAQPACQPVLAVHPRQHPSRFLPRFWAGILQVACRFTSRSYSHYGSFAKHRPDSSPTRLGISPMPLVTLGFFHSVQQQLVSIVVASLQELIAPFSEPEFLAMLRARSLVFRRGADEKKFDAVLDWDKFRSVIENDFPPDKLRVTRDGKPVMSHMYVERGKVNVKNLGRLLEHGASLIASPFEAYVPQVQALCADVARHVNERTYCGVVATVGRGCAIRLHYDPQDILILQITGTKRWKIYDHPVVCPVVGMPEQTPPQSEPIFDDTLRPGDFLFVPAGHWHHCENGPERCLHLGILIEPPTGWHAIKTLLSQVQAEEMFRMPLTRFGSPAEKAAHELELRKRLHEKIEKMSLSESAVARKALLPDE
jgi:ribosomal protein L16 Arg81 hydroxylase